MFGNFFKKRELRKIEIEQKRREEYEKLKEKLKENEILTEKLREGLSNIYKIFKEFEETAKKSALIYGELEEKTEQIEILKSKSYKFIFKIINDWKINKLTRQREKKKQSIEGSEKLIDEKKEGVKKAVYGLLDSFD